MVGRSRFAGVRVGVKTKEERLTMVGRAQFWCDFPSYQRVQDPPTRVQFATKNDAISDSVGYFLVLINQRRSDLL